MLSQDTNSASPPTEPANEFRYRSLSASALVGLGLGGLSPLAMLNPLLWMVPVAGLTFAGFALYRLRNEEENLVGRGAAMVGLALSITFAAAAPAATVSYRWWLEREAQPVALHWFELLAADQPRQAHAMGLARPLDQASMADLLPTGAAPPDDDTLVEQFANEPLIRTLLALGDRAQVRYWSTESVVPDNVPEPKDQVQQIYAVSYQQAGQTTTFFVRLGLERRMLAPPEGGRWRITSHDGGVRP